MPTLAGPPRTSVLASTRAAAALVFLVCIGLSAFSLGHDRQLGTLFGLTDEWYLLGANLAESGTLGLPHQPSVHRAPGYPFFLATALRVLAGAPRGGETLLAYMQRGTHAVLLAQAATLAATAAVLVLWLAPRLGLAAAVAAGLLFGTSPYTVALTGLLHYDVLHMFALVASCALTDRAVGASPPRTPRLLLAGAAWGLASLVRPVTLLLPLFLLPALVLRLGSWRGSLRGTAAITLGMIAAIAPWTARNYRRAGHLLPVNAQGWIALWGSTELPLAADPNHYRWDDLYYRGRFLPVFRRVTGEEDYSLPAFVRNATRLETAFRELALENLRTRPSVYLGNATRSFLSFNFRINSVFLELFQELQRPDRVPGAHFGPNPIPYRPSPRTWLFIASTACLTLLAWGALWTSLRGQDPSLAVSGAAYLCIALTHSLVYMDFMYYYVKLPFLLVFAFHCLAALDVRPRRALTGLLVALHLGTLSILFPRGAFG